jgi:hypothetical protein
MQKYNFSWKEKSTTVQGGQDEKGKEQSDSLLPGAGSVCQLGVCSRPAGRRR